MKFKFHIFFKTLFISLFILSFSACHNLFEDEEPEQTNEYLINYELEKSYLPGMVEQIFDQLAVQFPEISFIRDRVEHGIMIYKIVYKTTFQGEEKQASGLVCVPMGEGTFPLISYQNGTNTLNSNAPSVNPNRDLYMMLEFVASTGFIIAIPDYLGFGSSKDMFHPYMHKESTIQSVLDMLRAAEELTVNYLDVNINNDLYITGYSQGGWATMQVQKAIEEHYSNEFHLKASACGAGPYDLSYMNEYILEQSTYPMPYFAGYLFNSYINLEAVNTPFDALFNEPYASLIPTLYDGSRSGEEINDELTTSVDELFTDNYLNNYKTDDTFKTLLTTLEDNSIHGWETSIPTRIYHGTADQFVPYQTSENIYNEFLEKEVSSHVELISIEGLDHIEGIIPAELMSINWFLELTE